MARPNKQRSVGAERTLARRLKREREARGWSPAEMAKRMTDAGCSIAVSAIYKIEDGEPPRKISVDEYLAAAAVFDLPPADLLLPLDVVDDRRAEQLIDNLQVASGDYWRSMLTYYTHRAELTGLMELTNAGGSLDIQESSLHIASEVLDFLDHEPEHRSAGAAERAQLPPDVATLLARTLAEVDFLALVATPRARRLVQPLVESMISAHESAEPTSPLLQRLEYLRDILAAKDTESRQ